MLIAKIEKLGLIQVLPSPYCACIAPCDISHFEHWKWKLEEKHFFPGKKRRSRSPSILEGLSINTFEHVITI
jgi:hypothetical protein